MGVKCVKIIISNEITITDATQEILDWCKRELVLPNPEYAKKERMGLWVGNTPRTLSLYKINGNSVIIPIGAFKYIKPILNTYNIEYVQDMANNEPVEYNAEVNLYDYQEKAVEQMLKAGYGILQSPAGSGKTQMGIALAVKLGKKCLWLTHTQDLLKQSYDRASQYIDKSLLGTITAGKVNIGSGITFATVQTLSKQDLTQYKYMWDVVITDECFSCDTLISTINGYKKIKDINYGDMVLSYNHKTKKAEYKPVIHKFSKGAESVLTVFVENGKMVITGNHPIYTQRGYIKAEELTNGDYVLRDMSETCRFAENEGKQQKQGKKKRLRLLFKGMFKKRGSSSQYMDTRKTEKGIGTDERAEQDGSIYKAKTVNENKQSYEQTRDKGKGIKDIKGTRSQTAYKGWKRNRTDRATENVNGCVDRIRSIFRVCCANKKSKRGLSYLLQNRFSNTDSYVGNRNRWKLSLFTKKTRTGQEENGLFKWVRVESIEVQEQTSDGTFDGLCPDGKVYNIGVEDNHNYFANNILVHNCHRVAGTPTTMTQFSKVISNLACNHKYGLSATVHRADGMIKCAYMLIGDVKCIVPDEAVKDKVMAVSIERIDTGCDIPFSALDTDGTINYTKLISSLAMNTRRNDIIYDKLMHNSAHYNLILSDRLDQLYYLYNQLPPTLQEQSAVIDGKMTSKKAKAEREQAIEDMRTGKKHFLFASYKLAKEGLDIPRLDRLHLATPQKDYAIIVQSVGRVARTFEGKEQPICYDYVDKFKMAENMYKTRCRHYRKCGCVLNG